MVHSAVGVEDRVGHRMTTLFSILPHKFMHMHHSNNAGTQNEDANMKYAYVSIMVLSLG